MKKNSTNHVLDDIKSAIDELKQPIQANDTGFSLARLIPANRLIGAAVSLLRT